MSALMSNRRNARLRREYLDLLENPVANCSAAPCDETDLGKWHANILVPELDNIVFHFSITYPATYPKEAPKVRNRTYIKHQNVFGTYICLDILTMSKETANTPFRGWTPAYTISSLLVQLQSFLFESISSTSGSGAALLMQQEARAFKCTKCGHHKNGAKDICPPIPLIRDTKCIIASTTTPTTIEDDEINFLNDMDHGILLELFGFLDLGTMSKIRFLMENQTNVFSLPGYQSVIDLAVARRSYKCYYTLKDIQDPKMVLGIGAKKFIMDKRSRKTGRKKACLQQLNCSFDFVSHEAYTVGVRNNIWKDRDFDWFCPIYINSEHGRKALPLAEKCILDLWNDRQLPTRITTLSAERIMDALTKMMNTTVVNIMKTVEDLEAGELQLFDSIKALEGYSAIHHLLLAFADKYPQIKRTANEQVKAFIDNPLMRDKEVTPDIGELFIQVAISDYSWNDFAPAWVEEAFIRNARWILAKYPNLLKFEGKSSCVRLTQSFNATRTGKRLAMFQRFFISEVCSPAHLRGKKDKNKLLLQEYNNRLGFPAKGMAEKLQAHSRKVIACNNWWDYFELIDFCAPSHARLSAWLRNSVEISEIKLYHERRKILRYDQQYVTQPNQTDQLNTRNCLCAGQLYQLPETCSIIPDTSAAPKLVRKKKQNIDICFVLDCTGSMGSWIKTAKKEIQNIISTVTRKCQSKVRFAIAGYRDHHGQGSGDDKYVVKEYDFTPDPKVASTRVSQFSADGGADYPEAMCCAMKAAADMSWNRDSHQLVVLIADAPPHGLVSRDDYPDGCPCGQDSLRIVHTMSKNGVVVYPVDCGSSTDAKRQTFFHALARITGGYALTLKDAAKLPEIVLGACMEEKLMDKLSDTIAPFYEKCLENHSIGRFEQHCRSVYAEMNARNIMVESSLPPDRYDRTIEHQVETLAFAMDLKQAKALCESEYFIPIHRETKLSSFQERPVTQDQVTKCMKRMKGVIAEKKFLREGCQYKSKKRFSEADFKARWKLFKGEREMKGFHPWNRLTPEKKEQLARIPDGAKMKAQKERKLASVRKQENGLILPSMVGREIQVQLHGNWHKVRILKVNNRGKVLVLDKDGFEMEIKDTDKWKPVQRGWGTDKTESKPAPAAPTPVPARAPVPAPVSRRAEVPIAPTAMTKNISLEVTEKEANRATRHVARERIVGGPSATARQPIPARSRSNSRCRPSSNSSSAERTPSRFVKGQMVNCTNDKAGEILVGYVASLHPLLIQTTSSAVPTRYQFVRPVKTTEYILKCDGNVYAYPECHPQNGIGHLSAFTKVEVVETADVHGRLSGHIIKPCVGWIRMKNKVRWLVRKAGEALEKVDPILVISDIADDLTAMDIGHKCAVYGFKPKNVRIVLHPETKARTALATFESHGHADSIMTLGLTDYGTKLKIEWLQEYLEYREKAI